MYLFKTFPKFILISVLAVIPTLSSCGLIGSADAGPEVDAEVKASVFVVTDGYGGEYPKAVPQKVAFVANEQNKLALRLVAEASGTCTKYAVSVKSVDDGSPDKGKVRFVGGRRKAEGICLEHPKDADFVTKLTPGSYTMTVDGKSTDVVIYVYAHA